MTDKRKFDLMIVSGEKGMGMTYFSLRMGDKYWFKEPKKELLHKRGKSD
jgi:hypothetical protein